MTVRHELTVLFWELEEGNKNVQYQRFHTKQTQDYLAHLRPNVKDVDQFWLIVLASPLLLFPLSQGAGAYPLRLVGSSLTSLSRLTLLPNLTSTRFRSSRTLSSSRMSMISDLMSLSLYVPPSRFHVAPGRTMLICLFLIETAL